jgi:serpin B
MGAGLAACQSGLGPVVEEEQEHKPVLEGEKIELTRSEQQMAARSNVFAFNLLREVAKNEAEGTNLLVSPLSASLALAMLNNGADGRTREEIQEALGYGDVSNEEMNGYFQKMIRMMQKADPNVAFEAANSIWIRNTFPVLDAFKEVNTDYYEAEIRNEDFSDPATVSLINDWCAEKTHDKIPTILYEPVIPEDVIMYLINALYFKGTWTLPFDKTLTTEEPFRNWDGTTSKPPVMNLTEAFWYHHGETFDLLELPYGNQSFGMILLLPHEDVSLASIVEEMDAETWNTQVSMMYPALVSIKLPRFKIEYEKTLNKDLMGLGMVSMFGAADLTRIHPTAPLVVSEVRQKTYAELNEEGTEAAAVTLIAVSLSMDSKPPAPSPFYVDRPFLYLIREKSTGVIFFTGRMNRVE